MAKGDRSNYEEAPVDSQQNARTVREDTAELATYLLSDGTTPRRPSFLQRSKASAQDLFASNQEGGPRDDDVAAASTTILEVSEPASPQGDEDVTAEDIGPSVLSNLIRRSPPQSVKPDTPISPDLHPAEPERKLEGEEQGQSKRRVAEEAMPATERTPLLGQVVGEDATAIDIEGQQAKKPNCWLNGLLEGGQKAETHLAHAVKVAVNPHHWNRKALWENVVVEPISCLPAVAVGLLLNILDALSYGESKKAGLPVARRHSSANCVSGMILFPVGKQLFSHLGSAGISIYYVSTIVAQVTFSSGSIFRGAVGSELVRRFEPPDTSDAQGRLTHSCALPPSAQQIEVVPFFHNMAQKITDNVGQDNADAVIATTITAYAFSSIITGLVFYLMGKFKFGYMVGFIPRHILIGCIGGVGWFLVATGFEVSARLDGNLKYNLDTLNKLVQADTVLLWIFPLALAAGLFYGQSKIRSKYFLPLFILAIPLLFYVFVLSIDALDADDLRDKGWIFQGPPPGEPWWYFYTLYRELRPTSRRRLLVTFVCVCTG